MTHWLKSVRFPVGWIVAMLLAAAASLPAQASGASCVASSGPTTRALVELYTSEGCSSCPPADRWLSSNFPADAAPANAIALAFHVDYWDRLGWKDRFASAAWTQRQQAASRANGTRFVYTPQVLIQGKDFPDWHGKGAAAIASAAAKPARASVSIEAQPKGNAIAVKTNAHVQAAGDRKAAALYVALADSRLVSDVKAGENAGARLTHDHVVRALSGGIAVNGNGDAAGELTLPVPGEAGTTTTLVAFVQNAATGDVLQTVALPFSPAACSTARPQ